MFLLISIIFISIIGTISHFTYDISNKNKIIGLFSAVNESTWEHIKIALTPTFLWSIIDGIKFGNNPNYFIAKFINLITIIVLIPILFYGYKFILKKDIPIIDISIFYITIIVSQYLFYRILNINELSYSYRYLSCIGTFIIFGCYLLLTLLPPKSFLFKDPITNKYGFKGHI